MRIDSKTCVGPMQSKFFLERIVQVVYKYLVQYCTN
jgi:hypothetical protein